MSDECPGCVLKTILKVIGSRRCTLISEWVKAQKRNIPKMIFKHEYFVAIIWKSLKLNELKWIIFKKELYTVKLFIMGTTSIIEDVV